MKLKLGGVDIFYIDESERDPLFAVSAVRIPFLRQDDDEQWNFCWNEYMKAATEWRRALSKRHSVRVREELHAFKLINSRGLYKNGHVNLRPDEAVSFYKDALATLSFLPERSIVTTFARSSSSMTGHSGIRAAMAGLFQRIRTYCLKNHVNGMIFFDDGHPEYIRWYREATKWLPTGSNKGSWGGSATSNLPLDMFPKDANLKRSDLSLFLQIADLVVYSARMKIESEQGLMAAKRVGRNHGSIYDSIPTDLINLAATRKRTDGLVPI